MRRGSRVLLLVGLLIAAAAAVFLFLILGRTANPQADVDPANQTPTAIPEVEVVTARVDIPRGIVITDTETYLTLSPIPEDVYNSNPERYLRAVEEAEGLLTANPIARQSEVDPADLTTPGLSEQIPTAEPDQPRPKAYPLRVGNLSGVADLIKPGDTVDILTSFEINRTVIGAGIGAGPDDTVQIQPREVTVIGRTTKTVVQNVEVLRVLKPAQQPPAEGEGTPTAEGEAPEGEGPPPGEAGQSGQTPAGGEAAPAGFQTGTWILILAVTDQEAEIIKFSQEAGQQVTLVLRGSGDREVEQTTGATLDLMITRYGVPVPDPFLSRETTPLTPVPAPAAPTP